MKKVLIIGVNYNSYDYVDSFLKSINKAASFCHEAEVEVVIADNTIENKQEINIDYDYLKVQTFSFPNLGYFGAALNVYSNLKNEYDFIAISNIDLTMDEAFFVHLNQSTTTGIAWIAPDIYTPRTNTHENPNLLHRPSKFKFAVWMTIYSCPLIYQLYHWLYKMRHKKPLPVSSEKYIYSGHGSFILLTSEFKKVFPQLTFPCFMYGEEIFLAELIRQTNMKVQFVPTVKIMNIGKASVNQLPSKQVFHWSKESLKYLFSHFFK